MSRPYVVTISSEKGGVGKTTLATNLAIYLKALREDLPVTLVSLDNHFSVDRMFRIGKGSEDRPGICDLFRGVQAETLAETGEYGVEFIPSSRSLTDLRDEVRSPRVLAAALAVSALTGILIIDTRPVLDIFTHNALFAADRVIVPVKDAASLENARNIYDFFDRQGLSRRSLRLLPCLIDSRIRFDGPFRDSYQLLKGYAINRGYRCMEGFIAKSPKVESLNTNPTGRIYPVITHGRGTEVHLQLTHLARQIYLETLEEKERRLDQVAAETGLALSRREDSFRQRRAELSPGCLACGRPLVAEKEVGAAGYYGETSDGLVKGFIEEECFSDLVFRQVYVSKREVGLTDPLRDLFRESAQRSFFVLRRTPNTQNFFQPQVSFFRFDEDGLEVSQKVIDLKEFETRLLSRERTSLFRLTEKTLCDGEGRLGEAFLLVRRVGSDFPEEILYEENYRRFRAVADRVAAQFPS